MNKKHICLVSPSFNIGGIERTVSEFANHFASLGHSVTFISLLPGERHFILRENISVLEPPFRRSRSTIVNGLYRLRLISFIRRSIKDADPDVVLSMSDTFNYLVIASTLGLRCKVFVGDVTKPDRKLAMMTRLGKKFFYPKSSGFIAQTNAAAKYYQRVFGDRLNMRVINGAVKKIEQFNTERKAIILCAGRLSYEKGQDRLIQAFSMIEGRGDWKVVFTADGPFKARLVQLVDENKLNDSVIFAGKVDNIDLLYAEASIFVLPSRIEGFPNALTEAMAAGLPCVCYDSFPANEIISHGKDGFVLQDGDIHALARKVELLMQDMSLRKSIGKEAEKISERLSIENIGQQMLSFIMEETEK